MSDTPSARGYGWGLQVDYPTQKALSSGSIKEIVNIDQNFIDFEPQTANDEEWSHPNINSATDEWIETQNGRVSHSMPGFSQQMGELFYINGSYAVSTPPGGSSSKKHVFKPTDPTVTRQDKAVTYCETTGAGWNVLMPSCVADGWVIKGNGKGVITLDYNLIGSGKLNLAPGTTWYPTSTPNVARRTGQHKLFNSQVALVVTDGGSPTTYGCRYRSFEFAYKKTMLDDAGMSPGCGNFLVAGDPTSGMIRSAHEFDKQMLDFTLVVDMASGSPEAIAVQQQKPLLVVLTVAGGIIETTIRHQLKVTIPVAKYKTAKAGVGDGIMQFTLSGKALFDFATNKLFEVELINDIATYASAF